MSIFSKVITTVFGKKSDKDLKKLSPFVDQINNHFESLSSLTDKELQSNFLKIKEEFKVIEDEFKKSYDGDDFEKELRNSIEDGLNRKLDWKALIKIKDWLEF